MFKQKIKIANDNFIAIKAKYQRSEDDLPLYFCALLGFGFALMLFGFVEAIEMFTSLIVQAVTR